MSNSSSLNQAPSIRAFQFDGDGIGAIKNSVNLFRGDVNLPISLLNLTGRNNLDVEVKILAQSNVKTAAQSWNQSNPTGILGLGWQLPVEKIIVDNGGSGNNSNNKYYLSTGDSNQALVISKIPWQRMTLSLDFVSTLDSNAKVDDNLQKQFGQMGIVLSPSTLIEVTTEGNQWRLSDPDIQQTFNIKKASDELKVFDGGVAFETLNYQFWRIRYYPEYERWAITRDNGLTSSYGGLTNIPNQQALGNSIVWGVKWGNWIGTSQLVNNADAQPAQQRYAKTWQLSAIYDFWGEKISYQYDTVEQAVGTGGLTYTKASYLTQITDVFERQIQFQYGEKTYDNSSKDAIREYLDPNKVTPDNKPNAYQDRYETRYLSEIVVKDKHQQQLYHINLNYELNNVSTANKNENLYGDTFKRFLTSVNLTNPDGEALPGLEFEYELSNQSQDNSGALKNITYPQGGVASYTYELATLDNINRTVKINNPFPTQAKPRTWFGKDYAVSCWYLDSAKNPELKLTVYNWLAGWSSFAINLEPFQHTIDIDTLEVYAAEDFFALYFYSIHTQQYQLFLFHKNSRAQGQWHNYTPTNNAFGSKPPRVAGGDKFFLIAYQDATNAEKFNRYTWQQGEHIWDESQPSSNIAPVGLPTSAQKFYVTGLGNYYAVLCYDTTGNGQNRLQLFYHDAFNNWHDGPATTPEFVIAKTNGDFSYFRLVPTATSIAASVVTSFGSSPHYSSYIFSWDENFSQMFSNSQTGQLKHFVPIGPDLMGDALIGFGPKAYRFNGDNTINNVSGNQQGWLAKDIPLAMMSVTNQNKVYRWSATSENFIVTSANAPLGISAQFVEFNPNIDSQSWDSPIQSFYSSDKVPDFRSQQFYVSAVNANYFTFNTSIYGRQIDSDITWDNVKNHQIFDLNQTLSPSQAIDTTTIINNAPNYLAYLIVNQDNPVATKIAYFKNGKIKTDSNGEAIVSTLEGEYLFQSFDDKQGRQKQNINGKLSGGGNSFYTTPNEDVDKASYITLHHFSQDSVIGALTDYRVNRIDINNGFETNTTLYDYQDSTAGFDPTGNVAKYYQVTTYPGTDNKQNTPFGRIVNNYLNGLPSEQSGKMTAVCSTDNSQQNYTMLDGMLLSTTTYDKDGAIQSSKSSHWFVFDTIKDINDDNIEYSLFGGWIRSTQQTQTVDGVIQQTNNQFDSASGQKTQESTEYYDGIGQKINQVKELTYAYQNYQWTAAHNILSAQTSIAITQNDNPQIVNAMPLSHWTRPNPLNSAAPITVWTSGAELQWRGSTQKPHFDFAHWTPQTTLADWLCTKRFVSRNHVGLLTESVINETQTNSTIYSEDAQYVIANIANGSISAGQVSFYGFESYQSNPGWVVSSQNIITKGTAFSGVQSLQMPANKGATLSLNQTPQDTSAKYVFYGRIMTPQGFTVTSGTGWTIKFYAGNTQIGTTVQLDFAATQGSWQYFHQILDLAALQQSNAITVKIEANNNANKSVFLDCLTFTPLLSQVISSSYDTINNHALDEIGPWNKYSRNAFNRFGRKIAKTNSNEAPSHISFSCQSREQLGNDNKFSPTAPNSQAVFTPMGEGFYQDFSRDPNFLNLWQTEQHQWQVKDGTLQQLGNARATLTLKSGLISATPTLITEVDPLENLSGELGCQFGEHKISYSPTNKTWQLLKNDTVIQSINNSEFTKAWALVINEQSLLFFANGQLLFSHQDTFNSQDALSIFVTNKVSIDSFLIFSDSQISVNYADGADNVRQFQSLTGNKSQLHQVIYDTIGRESIKTKSAVLNAATTESLMFYRDDLVTDINQQTGVMTGKISDSYPDDNGYPYWHTRYDDTTSKRVVEQGAPGEEFAIVPTIDISERHTIRTSYSTNKGGVFPPASLNLPEQQYQLITTVDQNGHTTYELNTQQGGTIASGCLLADSSISMTTSNAIVNADGSTLQTSKLPNYYSNTVQDKSKFVINQTFNALTLANENHSPNSDKVSYIYDNNGAVRFYQDANGRSGTWGGIPYIVYVKYDSLGRKTEMGVLPYTWGDGSELQTLAEDPSFPSTGNTPTQQLIYDINPSNPTEANNLGSLVQYDTIKLIGNNTKVSTQFGYDVSGNATDINQTVDVYQNGKDFNVQYQYNNQNKVSGITYPKATNLQIDYIFNQLGQMSQILKQDAGNQSIIANFEYNPMGMLSSETFETQNAKSITRTFDYNSPGWLCAINNDQFSQTLTYTSNGYQGAKYYNRQIASNTSVFGQLQDDNFLTNSSFKYAYDSLGQLNTSACYIGENIQPQFSEGIDNKPNTYDSNGNLLSVYQSAEQQNYAYNLGTDQVITTGNNQQNINYDPNGAIISSPNQLIDSLTYGPSNQQAEQIVQGSSTTDLAYGNLGQKVYQTETHSSANQGDNQDQKLYVYGANPYPLITESPSQGITCYLYGPSGMFAFEQDGKRNNILKDHLGSTRMIIGPDNTAIAAYNYQSFGDFLQKPFSVATGDDTKLDFLYSGQELNRTLGLYNNHNRLYDPKLRIFYSVDPQAANVSPYSYADNNPILFIDPTGESANIFGIIFSSLEIAVGLLTAPFGGFAAVTDGALGLAYTIKADNKFNYGSFFEVQASATISIAEISAAVTVDILSEGALANTLGATLMGAGVSGLLNTGQQVLTGKDGEFSMTQFLEQQAIGAASGMLTAGLGSLGGVAGKAAANQIENAAGRYIARIGFSAVAGAAGGFSGGFAGNIMKQAFDGKSIDFGKAAKQGGERAAAGFFIGAASGAIAVQGQLPNGQPAVNAPVSNFANEMLRRGGPRAWRQLVAPIGFNAYKTIKALSS